MQPFRIEIPEEVLVDLGERLARTRWPDDLGNVDWSYGSNVRICASSSITGGTGTTGASTSAR